MSTPMERDPLREAAQGVVDAWVDDESGMETFDPSLIDALAAALQAVPEAGSPCHHDAKWIEDYTRWAVEMDRRNRGDAIPAEPPRVTCGACLFGGQQHTNDAGCEAAALRAIPARQPYRGAFERIVEIVNDPGRGKDDMLEEVHAIARACLRGDAIPAEPLDVERLAKALDTIQPEREP